MKKFLLVAAFALFSTASFAGTYDSEPGTRAYTIPSEQLERANLRDCCDGRKPLDSVIVSVDHSKVPNGKSWKGDWNGTRPD